MVKSNFIDIYTHSGKESIYNIKPASVLRDWMDNTNGWAYNCLPLKIANQYGWVAHSPSRFTAEWNGGSAASDLVVETEGTWAKSHFAHGTMTIDTDFLINTTAGTSLYVRGLTNTQKDLIYPMDAIIETDWLPFHFPFSYKFLKPGKVIFEKDEPLFMFFPIPRDFIESFDITFKHLDQNPDLKKQNKLFSQSRQQHMMEQKSGAQKSYIKGSIVQKKQQIENHQVKINLKQPEVK